MVAQFIAEIRLSSTVVIVSAAAKLYPGEDLSRRNCTLWALFGSDPVLCAVCPREHRALSYERSHHACVRMGINYTLKNIDIVHPGRIWCRCIVRRRIFLFYWMRNAYLEKTRVFLTTNIFIEISNFYIRGSFFFSYVNHYF